MCASKKSPILQKHCKVVATIPTSAALALALELKPGAVDLFEVRVDHFADNPVPLLRALPQLAAPLIITVRHPAEGGVNNLSFERRRELFARFLEFATFIDLELRSFRRMQSLVTDARARGVELIASTHFFKATPKFERLGDLALRAREEAADHFKIATLTRSMPDVLRLLRFLLREPFGSMSVMGMGSCGKISRLVLACAGSVLNYGYLDAIQVDGQWPAPLLKERLAELA